MVKSGALITITGSQYASTEDHLLSVSVDDTDGWAPGRYSYQAKVTNGTDSYIVDTGTIDVRPDFSAQSTGYDDRSFNKRSLDAIEAVIEGRASKSQSEYTIAGRQLKFVPMTELMEMRSRFLSAYLAEERRKQAARSGRSIFGKIPVRFS